MRHTGKKDYGPGCTKDPTGFNNLPHPEVLSRTGLDSDSRVDEGLGGRVSRVSWAGSGVGTPVGSTAEERSRKGPKRTGRVSGY